MNLLQAVLLGIVQGATEFIPVSSTAHMVIAIDLLKLEHKLTPQQITAAMAVVQLGTLLAVLAYFWRDLLSVLRGVFWAGGMQEEKRRGRRLFLYMIIGTVPVAIAGVALKHVIEGALTKNLMVIASSLIGVALLLALAEAAGSRRRGESSLRASDALVIGLAQVFALIPGSSRSGTTLTAALFLGLRREAGARFSFLLSIPAVAASGLLELVSVRDGLAGVGWTPLLVGVIAAAVVGFVSIDFLLRYLRKRSTLVFVVYRVALGAAILVLLIGGVLGPAGTP